MRNSISAAAVVSALCISPAFASTIEGTCLEAWSLPNFQPKSPTHLQRVESGSYADTVTVVVLLASW